ncbi:MAG: pyruvate kinase, partial [Pseudomonadales bacterium]
MPGQPCGCPEHFPLFRKLSCRKSKENGQEIVTDMMRKTKIICTIGPATDSYPMIEQLYEAGMDIVRLNMSHATRDSAARVI